MINILGFSDDNLINDNEYFLNNANNFTSPGLLNINSANSLYYIRCPQVSKQFNHNGYSDIISKIYLHQIPVGAYAI